MISLRERKCKNLCGEHWLVKTSDVHIQAKYSDSWTWVERVAIGGPSLQNHSLVINAGGRTTWDGRDIVTSFPASFKNEFVQLRYYKNHVWQSITNTPQKQWRRTGSGYNLQTMQLELPQHLTLTVNVNNIGRFIKFLDIFITMPIPASGTNGHCGKADGDMRDDTTRNFLRTINSYRVDSGDSLFGDQVALIDTLDESSPASTENESLTVEECLNGTMAEVTSICSSALPENSSPDWVSACADDVCAGGEAMIDHALTLAAQTELKVEEEVARIAEGDCHTCTVDEACFDRVSWAMEIGVPSEHYLGRVPALDASSCFEEVQAALREWQQDPEFVDGMQEIPVPCAGQPERFEMHDLSFCR